MVRLGYDTTTESFSDKFTANGYIEWSGNIETLAALCIVQHGCLIVSEQIGAWMKPQQRHYSNLSFHPRATAPLKPLLTTISNVRPRGCSSLEIQWLLVPDMLAIWRKNWAVSIIGFYVFNRFQVVKKIYVNDCVIILFSFNGYWWPHASEIWNGPTNLYWLSVEYWRGSEVLC